MIELESSSPEETERIAAAVARGLRAGDVVTVAGDLGTGKTTFVRGACRALGVSGPVTSPTYTIGNRYHGRLDVSHLDLYRFDHVSDAEWGDLERYFEDAVVFVEWPEAGVDRLPRPRARVRLQHLGPDHRLVVVAGAEKSLEKRVLSSAYPRV
jgi:tRNA threonylcarbamoyladenosine biosynthesis protein TsaE